MPPLWKRLSLLRRPEPYLAAVLMSLVLVGIDAARPPSRQIVARWYLSAVRGYQQYGRPLTTRIIRCRYRPTCSEYSLEAVRRLGIVRGLQLTAVRLSACRESVPFGTADPVPAN